MSAPKPWFAPTYSATTAPTKLSIKATLKPLNIAGTACGTRSFRSVVNLDARSARKSSNLDFGVDVSPIYVFSTSGKKAIKAAIIIFGAIPKPNQMTNIGARANFGKA